MSGSSSAGPATGPTTTQRVVATAQAALAAEHAAVYGYGVVGARIDAARRAEATAAYQAHRARRDALRRTVADLGAPPVAAYAGYALPFRTTGPAAAARLAAYLEDRVCGAYADLVRDARGRLRRDAAGALRDAAVRAVRWRGSGTAFPGLPEAVSGSSLSSPPASGTASPIMP